MLRAVLSFLALLGFCCFMVACNSDPTTATERVVDPETRPGVQEGSGPKVEAI